MFGPADDDHQLAVSQVAQRGQGLDVSVGHGRVRHGVDLLWFHHQQMWNDLWHWEKTGRTMSGRFIGLIRHDVHLKGWRSHLHYFRIIKKKKRVWILTGFFGWRGDGEAQVGAVFRIQPPLVLLPSSPHPVQTHTCTTKGYGELNLLEVKIKVQ